MRRPLPHVRAKDGKLRRFERLIEMHIEVHPILAEHRTEQDLRIEAWILDAALAKEIRRPCEKLCNRPNRLCHQFTCFSRSA